MNKASRIFSVAIAMFFFATAAGPVFAVEPDEILQDVNLEARARGLSKELRCLVCQNENIDSSHAPLARDLRVLLRERLTAGDTDEEVLAFLVERYGDFVLLKPPVQVNTMVLWMAPVIFMVFAAIGVLAYSRGTRGAPKASDLTKAETRRLAELLDRDVGPDEK